jgi:hypothetical protein
MPLALVWGKNGGQQISESNFFANYSANEEMQHAPKRHMIFPFAKGGGGEARGCEFFLFYFGSWVTS